MTVSRLSASAMKPWLFAIAVLTLAIGSIACASKIALAHANQLHSAPTPSQQLEDAPDRVIIWFTEPIESMFSHISVRSTTGAEMTVGETVFDPTEPQSMWIQLQELENGTYTVSWRNLSSIDGHKVSGSFLFSVGEPIGASAEANSFEQPFIQAPTDPFIRWAIYLGIAIFAGGLLFEYLVASHTLWSEDNGLRVSLTALRASHIFTLTALLSIATVITAQLAQLIQQVAVIYDAPWSALTVTEYLPRVIGSAWGSNWAWRMLIALTALATLLAAHRSRASIAEARVDANDTAPADEEQSYLLTDNFWGMVALSSAVAYLVLISLVSHSAAVPNDVRPIAIISDVMHIAAAATWFGGLVYLMTTASVSIRGASSSPDAMWLIADSATRFTPIAIIAAAALVASGIVSSLMQVTVPAAISTPHGAALVVKLLLLLPLIAIAGYNMLSLTRRLRFHRESINTLRKTVIAECMIAALALLAAAWMASLEPARLYAERKGIGIERAASRSEEIDGALIDAALEPGEVGANTLQVRLTDTRGAPFTKVEEVRARIKYLDDDFAEPYLPLEKIDEGVWEQQDAQISIAGAYQIEVNVVRSDAFDSRLSFRFSARSSSFASDLIRPQSSTALLLFGLQIGIIGMALILSRLPWSALPRLEWRQYLVNNRRFSVIGGCCMTVGAAIAINSFTLGIGVTKEAAGNPFPLTQESVQLGIEQYVAACASCHGDAGRGDGPASIALNPKPADLAVHVPLHSDADLFDFIANGIDGTAMTAQIGKISEEDIWHLVNYIRTIRE